jgi:DNA-binding winged helix-turn-helix (wHTH) protein
MPAARYKFGPFVADRVRYRGVRDDRALELTPKLLNLLLHLLENAGAVLGICRLFTEAIPTLGTGKVDLRGVRQLAVARTESPV